MSNHDAAFGKTLRKLLFAQLTLLVLAAVIALLQKGSGFTLALLYGGVVTLVGTLYSAQRLKFATQAGVDGPALNILELYKGIVLKFLLVVALLALGMLWLRLEPLAIVIGFATTQAGYLFVRGYAPRRRG